MLKLPTELTYREATACLAALSAQLAAQPDPVVVDAADLTHFDSSALAVLLELRRQALGLDRRFAVQGLMPKLRQLAGVYGVSTLLPEAV
jgi:phospholipid transport system transporter-binding protein